jgi:uncharacterized protein
LCILVASDGAAGWRILRAAVVLAVTAATLLIAWRWQNWGALIGIFLGSVALTIGVVFGFYHLMKTDFSWRVGAGFLDLAVGLTLLFLGCRILLSGLARGWLFLAVPVIVVVVLILTWITTLGVLATNVPDIPVGEKTPRDFGLAAQEVRFLASDGFELGGWYIPSTNHSAIVLRHGSGSTGSDVLAQASVLSGHGYGVLVTDARGHGFSSGRAMDFGWYGTADIEGAVSFLIQQPGIDASRIAVVGLSMGGEEAIGAAAEDPRISAVIAEGATGRTAADKSWLRDIYGIRGSIQMELELAQYVLTDWLTVAHNPRSLAEAARIAAPRPVLLITAGEVEDELYSAEYINRNSPTNVTIWTVQGAEHTLGLSTAPVDWENTVIGFLDSALMR